MPRLTQISDTEASPAAAELFGAIKKQVGMVPNLYRVAANRPTTLSGLLALTGENDKGAFDAQTRDAIALAVAGVNECDYCASAHSAISASLKVDQAEIASRLRGESRDPRIQAILTLAVAIVEKRGLLADADLAAARNAGLGDADIVETVGHVAQNIFTNYLNHIAQTDIDFPVVNVSA